MLSAPTAGWCKLTIGDFTGNPSYITDVPTDLLVTFIDYYKKGISAAFFDEEGADFNLLLSNYTIYIVYTDYYGKSSLYTFHDIDINDLAKELITDIKADINAWAHFSASCDQGLKWENKDRLLILTNELQELITNA